MTNSSRDGPVTFRVRTTEAQQRPVILGLWLHSQLPWIHPGDAQWYPWPCSQAGRQNGPSPTGRHLAILGGFSSSRIISKSQLSLPSVVRTTVASYYSTCNPTLLLAVSASAALGSPRGPATSCNPSCAWWPCPGRPLQRTLLLPPAVTCLVEQPILVKGLTPRISVMRASLTECGARLTVVPQV